MIALLAALAADAAHGETSYPAALDAASLSAWLAKATDIAPGRVVAVSPSAATAVIASTPARGGGVQLLLRAEALTPEAAARTGLLAWEMRLEVDCRGGQVRAGATAGFLSRRAEGEPISVAPAQADWRRPLPGTALEAAWRAVCDPRFRPPLAATGTRIASSAAGAAAVASPSLPGAAGGRTASAQIAPEPRPHRQGRRAAQVVSSPDEAETRRSLGALRSRFAGQLAGLDTRIEPAQVRGRTVFRGLVAGFATHDDAEAFCQSLKSHGQDCLAR